MKDTIIPLLIGVCVGAAVAWLPYGYAILSVFAVLTLIHVMRRSVDKNFRDKDKEGRRMTFYIFFWITIVVFHLKPSGVDTFIPVQNKNNVKVNVFLKDVNKQAPNIKFNYSGRIANKRISIHTITRITVAEALKLMGDKAGAEFTYTQDARGRSIAGGPRVNVTIVSKKNEYIEPGESGGPILYDGM